ncbi:MAG: tRNA (adenosine(37)-N6)-threonylcarbamoyltransferase complex transferase subunit TsaD [Verrucomicrobiota bacterium]|nr:tRNA (adenosine(37)-N6)-threonylcarbamoyltransferase complex transferase subunit TsaD [Verrucomicrobiota bacterium]
MLLLAIESSCDETSAAVIRDGIVLSNIVASQVKLHAEYGGVVPELATREHLRNLQPVVNEALKKAGFSPHHLDAIAATQGPGLPSALLIGFHAATAMAMALGKPLIGIHHHEAHLYSPWIWGTPPRAHFEEFQPSISLIVSGGHTLLVHTPSLLEHQVLGGTVDDAAGECFDKAAKLMGLPYPGGPLLDKLAQRGNPSAFQFPRPMIHDPHDDFSFSGLKTSIRYFVRDNPALIEKETTLCDLCASVQGAIVDVLVTKTVRAASRLGVTCVTASGGVTCNSALRQQLAQACNRNRLRLLLSDPQLATDNAAMIGILAEQKLLRGNFSSPSRDILPGWELATASLPE